MWLPSDAAATRLSWTAPIIATNRKSIGDYFAHRFVSFQIQSTPSEDDNRNMRHAGGVRRVLFRVLVSRVGCDLWGDVVSDALRDSISIGEQCAELIVELLEDVA
jgi:hypothetical protein